MGQRRLGVGGVSGAHEETMMATGGEQVVRNCYQAGGRLLRGQCSVIPNATESPRRIQMEKRPSEGPLGWLSDLWVLNFQEVKAEVRFVGLRRVDIDEQKTDTQAA
jgi:hypothetical protein